MTSTRFFNAHLIDPSQGIDGIGFMDIADGFVKIISLGLPPGDNAAERAFDCKKAILAPALLICVFNLLIRVPEHLESLPTLLAAAANGGITALACLPNTSPVIDEASAIDSHMPSRLADWWAASLRLWSGH